MMLRLLVLLLGIMVTGAFEALAVNAPQPVDPRTVEPRAFEPREDLFAPKPGGAAPLAIPAVAPPPAVPAAERVLSGNPLWAIPLGRLTASRDRPLFARTRRPPPVAAVASPAPMPVMSRPKPVEPEKPELTLLGTIAGREKIGLFIDSASKTVVRLKAGENHKGWVLRAVRPRQVELAKGLDSAVLDVPPPDVKVGPASTLAAPAVMPASSPPVGQVLPVNAAKATGALPAAAQPGATIVVQPPVFRPPPEPVNPFPKGRLP